MVISCLVWRCVFGSRVRPPSNRDQVDQALGRGGRVRGRDRAWPRQEIRAGHVPVPQRPRPHGARGQLHPGRRGGALLPAQGRRRPAPDGVRLLRAAGRERGDILGGPPLGLDARQHRAHKGRPQEAGLLLRLVAGALDLRAGLLPLDPVVLPEDVRERPRLQGERGHQLVPVVRHGAGERAGAGRRHL